MVSVYIICFNALNSALCPQSASVFHMVLTVNSINRLGVVAEMSCVSCEVRTEFLYNIRKEKLFKSYSYMNEFGCSDGQ
jgi:hypothetical protein